MELNSKFVRIMESLGFTVCEPEEDCGKYYVPFWQYTPTGEHWWCEIEYDGTDKDFIQSAREYWAAFDVDECVLFWIPRRGIGGVPKSIRRLLDNAEWKDNILEELADKLADAENEI